MTSIPGGGCAQNRGNGERGSESAGVGKGKEKQQDEMTTLRRQQSTVTRHLPLSPLTSLLRPAVQRAITPLTVQTSGLALGPFALHGPINDVPSTWPHRKIRCLPDGDK